MPLQLMHYGLHATFGLIFGMIFGLTPTSLDPFCILMGSEGGVLPGFLVSPSRRYRNKCEMCELSLIGVLVVDVSLKESLHRRPTREASEIAF